MKVTARNLRIREDTAKYLRNLDVDSAYYDPKSRSMRDDPNAVTRNNNGNNKDEDGNIMEEEDVGKEYAGDNFARISGDAVGLAKTQVFAWETSGGGVDGETNNDDNDGQTTAAATSKAKSNMASKMEAVHAQADPSRAELLRRKDEGRVEDDKERKRREVLERYGGAEHLDGSDGLASVVVSGTTTTSATTTNGAASEIDNTNSNNNNGNTTDIQKEEMRRRRILANAERASRFGSSVHEIRYGRDGRPIGDTNADGTTNNNNNNNASSSTNIVIPCKYEEDLYTNGHLSIFGSYFHTSAFKWGYADDHSLVRASYGLPGEKGRKMNDEQNDRMYGNLEEKMKARVDEMRRVLHPPSSSSSLLTSNNGNTVSDKSKMMPPPNVISSKMYGETKDLHATYDDAKVKAAMEKLRKEERESSDSNNNTQSNNNKNDKNHKKQKKNQYNSGKKAGTADVTEEEMEAYRLQKVRSDDPMASC